MSRFISLVLIVILSTALNSYAAQLTDSDMAAGKKPEVSDTVILSDFANCFPRSAMSGKSEKGKLAIRKAQRKYYYLKGDTYHPDYNPTGRRTRKNRLCG